MSADDVTNANVVTVSKEEVEFNVDEWSDTHRETNRVLLLWNISTLGAVKLVKVKLPSLFPSNIACYLSVAQRGKDRVNMSKFWICLFISESLEAFSIFIHHI